MNRNSFPSRFGGVSVRWAYLAAALGILFLFGSAAMLAQVEEPFDNQAGNAVEDLHGNRDLPPSEYQAIDWPDSSLVNSTLRSKLRAPMLSAVDQSLVPVLLPNADDIEQGTFIKLDAGYSFSQTVPQRYSMGIYAFRLRQTTVPITSSAKEKQQRAGNAVVRGQIAHVWESEGWWTALWEEFGARYRLDFSCGVQLNDKECEIVLSEILNMLDLAGGNFANQ